MLFPLLQQKMTTALFRLYITILLLVLTGSLTSFSTVPVKKSKATVHHQKNKRLQKKEQRLQKRFYRLQDQPKNRTRRLKKVEKRLEKVQKKQRTNYSSSYILGLLSMLAGIGSIVVWVVALFSSFVLVFVSSGAITVLILVILSILLSIAGLILGILHLSKHQKDPDAYNKIGFAITGLIISGIVLLLGLVLVFGAAFG